jgi:hypothetical protein
LKGVRKTLVKRAISVRSLQYVQVRVGQVIRKTLKILVITIAVCFVALLVSCGSLERRLLFFPGHDSVDSGLEKWIVGGELIGFAHPVVSPKNVWLMMHGNAGQAADRVYALPSFSPEDSVYILEYPGYGKRTGAPSKESFNAAAEIAYGELRTKFPNTPVCAVGESIGTGPACFLTTLDQPPDKLVLITPFDVFASVARDHFPRWMVAMLAKTALG